MERFNLCERSVKRGPERHNRRPEAGNNRAKANLQCRVVRKFQDGPEGHILRDDLIQLTSPDSKNAYPVQLRRPVALVEVDEELREMVFLTNNQAWSAQTPLEPGQLWPFPFSQAKESSSIRPDNPAERCPESRPSDEAGTTPAVVVLTHPEFRWR